KPQRSRSPDSRRLFQRMWERAVIFIRRAGTVILALSVILWALLNYPKPSTPNPTRAEVLAHSAAGRFGHAIEPVIAPLGYDWKIGIGLFASFAAREVFVSTMGQIYNIEDAKADNEDLRSQMRHEKRP